MRVRTALERFVTGLGILKKEHPPSPHAIPGVVLGGNGTIICEAIGGRYVDRIQV